MRPELAALAARQGGVFLRRQAAECGYSRKEIELLHRRGAWTRVRYGAYADAAEYERHDDVGRYQARARAVMLVLDEPHILSHTSAAALLQLPVWGADLSVVHVTRLHSAGGRVQAGVKHHPAGCPYSLRTIVDGMSVTCLERTAIDVAREYGFEAGLVVTDAVLHAGGSPALLEQVVSQMTQWPGVRSAQAVLEAADGGAESVGESLGRLLVVESGLPRPVTQVVITDGEFRARVDMLIEQLALVIEFDGKGKYQRIAEQGQATDADLVWAEKLREDRLRELGYEVVRLTWGDLFGARRVLALKRLAEAAHRASRRRNGATCLSG
ncbi:MAG TPA: type IV toxin-antitoxin system AbiEi family antitoxin domain-containing protein [Nocardioidaceae bacterium]|nr:type IV toxin-antitoxin system AbiEi family antitoxin domain-containing protein [Nocardioidaceae bacterium]